ncbi:MAG: hypothetical protein IPK74_13455 [Deltaproteobacteria bacterium]|nr:hypothetical protein [Deltaproteobacteria bacterium]
MPAAPDLRDALLTTLAPGLAQRVAAWPPLAAALAQLWADATAAVPSLATLDGAAARLGAQLAQGLDDDAEPAQAFAAIHVADLALACACAAGDRDALVAFEHDFGRELDIAYARTGGHGLAADDFRQRVHERLFVAPPGEPARIAGYGGRGSLRSWVRVAATRVLIDQARRAAPVDAPARDERLFDRAAGPDDAELDYMRRSYGPALGEAMREGLAALSPRQRNLLRQRYLHGLGCDRLATMYGVHRATAFRWLEEARTQLFANLRTALGQRLQIAEHELDAVIDLLASRVDVSVRRLLQSRIEPS